MTLDLASYRLYLNTDKSDKGTLKKRRKAMAEYFLDGSVTQPYWDQAIEPRLVINPGDTVVFDCSEPIGQLTPEWTVDDLKISAIVDVPNFMVSAYLPLCIFAG